MTSTTAATVKRTRTGRIQAIEFSDELKANDLLREGKELIAQARAEYIESLESSSSRAVCSRYTRFYDLLLGALYAYLERKWAREGRGELGSMTLIALGGYGRRELCLHSDVDVLFLVGDEKGRQEEFIKEFLHTLFDWKLEVGYSVRRLVDCLNVINADLESTTAMLESHYLVGSRPLFQHYHESFMRTLRTAGRRWFIQAKEAEWNRRREKYDASVYLLEPNLKESTGGLRDVHSVRWLLMVFKGSRDLGTLVDNGILTATELGRLRAGEDFILRLRNELHALSPRKNDVLNFESQIAITKKLKISNRQGHMAEEVLMRDYYRRARHVAKYCNRAFHQIVQHEKRGLGSMLAPLKRKRLDKYFFTQDSVIFMDDRREDIVRSEPERVMEMFAKAHELGLRVSERERERIEKLVPSIPPEFPRNEAARDHFLKLLNSRKGVARQLKDMHECGFLSAFMPEFEHVRCMVRMDYYHRYTVDEHLIKSVESFERLVNGPPEIMKHAASVANKIDRPDLLNLALLFHDVGKGRGRGHALIGGQIIQSIGRRLDLPREDVDLLQFLILSHLKISHVAQRRDLDEPEVARDLAEELGTPQRLDMLYVHTVCDVMAVSPEAMTQWKARLLEDCYRRTAHAMEDHPYERRDVSDTQVDTMSYRLWDQIRQKPGAVPEDEQAQMELRRRLIEFVKGVPERYLRTTRLEVITRHFLMTSEIDDKNRIVWDLEPGAGVSELIVCSEDVPGSFAYLCGALKAKQINICSAQIFSTSDGLAINCFQVTDLNNRPLPEGFRMERLRQDLNNVFLGKKTIEELIEKYDTGPKREQPERTVKRPSEIRFNNEGSPNFTILEVRTRDRPGLLYLITSTLVKTKLNIHRAMLNTEAYGVFDVFYVTDWEYNKLHDRHELRRIERALKQALDGEDLRPRHAAKKDSAAEPAPADRATTGGR